MKGQLANNAVFEQGKKIIQCSPWTADNIAIDGTSVKWLKNKTNKQKSRQLK